MKKFENFETHLQTLKKVPKRLVNVIIMNYIPEFERVLDELKKIYGEMLYNI